MGSQLPIPQVRKGPGLVPHQNSGSQAAADSVDMSPPIVLCTLLWIISMLPVQPPLPPRLVQDQSFEKRKLADWLRSAAASLLIAATQLKSREIDSPGMRVRRREVAIAWQQQR